MEVYRRLRAARDGVSLNMLWALESLLIGCHWRDLPPDRKAALRGRGGRRVSSAAVFSYGLSISLGAARRTGVRYE